MRRKGVGKMEEEEVKREEEGVAVDYEPQQPQKKFYRSRAHCNPLSHNDGFRYPLSPAHMDWTSHYPNYASRYSTVHTITALRSLQ